jgi:DNA-binding LacI/PurR family transcriptional regulator
LEYGKDLCLIDEPGHHQQSYAFGSLLAGKVLERGREGPTALFCLNDRIAIGAMRGLQEAGKRVPEDYSVIGLDNLPETEWTNPPLTTVDQNIGSLMERVQAALWQPAKSERPVHYKVEPLLVVRESTGRARG